VKPTEEQQATLDATGRVLLITARAGTGKTAHPSHARLGPSGSKDSLPGLQPQGQRRGGRQVPGLQGILTPAQETALKWYEPSPPPKIAHSVPHIPHGPSPTY